jgi:hypothetical protein
VTVKELKAKLDEYPDNAKVKVADWNEQWKPDIDINKLSWEYLEHYNELIIG